MASVCLASTEGFDWNSELAVQQGRFRDNYIQAEMLAGIAGYTVRDGGLAAAHRYRSQLRQRRQHPQFQHRHIQRDVSAAAVFCRDVDAGARQRLRRPPGGECQAGAQVLAVFGWDNLWRASLTDGLYGSGMTEYPVSTRSPEGGLAPSCRPTCAGGSIGISSWARSLPSSCPGRRSRRRLARTSPISFCSRRSGFELRIRYQTAVTPP